MRACRACCGANEPRRALFARGRTEFLAKEAEMDEKEMHSILRASGLDETASVRSKLAAVVKAKCKSS